MPNQVRVGFGITGVSKAESDLDRLRNKVTGIQKAGLGGVTKGVALGVGIGLVNQATMAVGGLVSEIGDMTRAAIEDEASQQKLRTSIEANVAGWDGNTKAIEKTLAARMKLGFSDDEQRDSLAKIVAATHDVNKALEVQRTAMDLARLKGISLAEAGDALIKVEAGQYRALKGLGIVLKEGATAQDALNAVQKIATGQADDYAKTTAGKMLVAQTKVNEALENLGYKLLPAVAVAADAASVAVDGLAFAFGNVDEETGKATPGILDYIPGIAQVKAISEDAAEAQDELAGSAHRVARDLKDKASPAIVNVAQDIEDRYIPAINEFASETKTASEHVVDYFGDMHEASLETLEGMVDDFFDPIETRFSILEAHRDLEADKAALAAAKTSTAIHDATNSIVTDLGKQADGLSDLGRQGKLTKSDVDKFKKDTVAAYKAMGKSVPAELQKVIDKLYVLAGFDGGAVDINVKVKTGVQGKAAGKKRAAGGPVEAGETYTVGEEGPETLVMGNQSGRIIPNGGGSNQTFIFYGANLSSEESVAHVVRRAMSVSNGAPRGFGGALA